jgi:hypothetical protein
MFQSMKIGLNIQHDVMSPLAQELCKTDKYFTINHTPPQTVPL